MSARRLLPTEATTRRVETTSSGVGGRSMLEGQSSSRPSSPVPAPPKLVATISDPGQALQRYSSPPAFGGTLLDPLVSINSEPGDLLSSSLLHRGSLTAALSSSMSGLPSSVTAARLPPLKNVPPPRPTSPSVRPSAGRKVSLSSTTGAGADMHLTGSPNSSPGTAVEAAQNARSRAAEGMGVKAERAGGAGDGGLDAPSVKGVGSGEDQGGDGVEGEDGSTTEDMRVQESPRLLPPLTGHGSSSSLSKNSLPLSSNTSGMSRQSSRDSFTPSIEAHSCSTARRIEELECVDGSHSSCASPLLWMDTPYGHIPPDDPPQHTGRGPTATADPAVITRPASEKTSLSSSIPVQAGSRCCDELSDDASSVRSVDESEADEEAAADLGLLDDVHHDEGSLLLVSGLSAMSANAQSPAQDAAPSARASTQATPSIIVGPTTIILPTTHAVEAADTTAAVGDAAGSHGASVSSSAGAAVVMPPEEAEMSLPLTVAGAQACTSEGMVSGGGSGHSRGAAAGERRTLMERCIADEHSRHVAEPMMATARGDGAVESDLCDSQYQQQQHHHQREASLGAVDHLSEQEPLQPSIEGQYHPPPLQATGQPAHHRRRSSSTGTLAKGGSGRIEAFGLTSPTALVRKTSLGSISTLPHVDTPTRSDPHTFPSPSPLTPTISPTPTSPPPCSSPPTSTAAPSLHQQQPLPPSTPLHYPASASPIPKRSLNALATPPAVQLTRALSGVLSSVMSPLVPPALTASLSASAALRRIAGPVLLASPLSSPGRARVRGGKGEREGAKRKAGEMAEDGVTPVGEINAYSDAPAGVWPEVLDLEAHDAANKHGMLWPDLKGEDDRVRQDVQQESRVLVRVITWNQQAKPPPPCDVLHQKLLPTNKYHIYVIGTQECEHSIAASVVNTSKVQWEAAVRATLGTRYHMLLAHTLQASHLMVFAHKAVTPLITELKSSAVPCGIGNQLGNKGGIGASFRLCGTSFAFVISHLAAGQRATKLRHTDFHRISSEIVRALCPADKGGATSLPQAFDHVVWAGDLNYRISSSRPLVQTLLQKNLHEVLLSHDQLTAALAKKEVFEGLEEGPLHFRPTYKFDKGCDVYDTSPKQRVPAWTDRVLFKPVHGTASSVLHAWRWNDLQDSLFQQPERAHQPSSRARGGRRPSPSRIIEMWSSELRLLSAAATPQNG